MKKVVKRVLFFIGRLWAYVYCPNWNQKLSPVIHALYSGWLSRSFRFFGKDARIVCPAKLLGTKYISVGNNVTIGKNAVLTAWDSYEGDRFCPEITIGDGTCIGEYCHISAIRRIVFGQHVLTGRWLTVVDNGHGRTDAKGLNIPPVHRPLYSKGSIRIGDNVWIGDKVTVLAGVTIGENSIIGANSVVTKNVPACSVVSGNPAKIARNVNTSYRTVEE